MAKTDKIQAAANMVQLIVVVALLSVDGDGEPCGMESGTSWCQSRSVEGDDAVADGSSIVGILVGTVDETRSSSLLSSHARRALGDIVVVVVADVLLIVATGSGLGAFRVEGSSNRLGIQLGSKERNVGESVGVTDGALDGATVGGPEVGMPVGIMKGALDGEMVAREDGDMVAGESGQDVLPSAFAVGQG
jgi:hypothetical protein